MERPTLFKLRTLLSQHYPISGSVKIHPDFTFESPLTGFFKVAYSQKQRGMGLYWARHPSDFNLGSADAKPGDDPHTYLICLLESHYDKDAGWNPDIKLEQHDIRWLHEQILSTARELPDVMLHEASLHRMGQTSFGSAYIGYLAEGVNGENGFSKLTVATNTTTGFEPLQICAAVGSAAWNRPDAGLSRCRPVSAYVACPLHALSSNFIMSAVTTSPPISSMFFQRTN